MNAVYVDTSPPKSRKRVRAVLSRWGFKLSNSSFFCPGFARSHIDDEFSALISKGYEIRVRCSVFNSKGILVSLKVL